MKYWIAVAVLWICAAVWGATLLATATGTFNPEPLPVYWQWIAWFGMVLAGGIWFGVDDDLERRSFMEAETGRADGNDL